MGSFEKDVWGSHFPTGLAGLRSARSMPASSCCQHFPWLLRMCMGWRGRVLGPAVVFSALVSVLLALLLLGEPTSSYKTKNSPEPYCVN